MQSRLLIAEQGNDSTVFINELDPADVIAVGYRRVLYGDHGPYLEFTCWQIQWEAFPVVKPKQSSRAYYDERFTADKHAKAYEQRKAVHDRPNPPSDQWSVKNHRHDAGYADYQPGYIYVSADCVQVLRACPSRKRARKG